MDLSTNEKLQLDRYKLMEVRFRDLGNNEVVFAVQTQCWVDPLRTDVDTVNDRIFRLYLLTKVAFESRISTHALRDWCYQCTGSAPDPVDLSKLVPNGE